METTGGEHGNSVAALEGSKGAAGRTLLNLAAAGVDPGSVDVVVMSHLHPDGRLPFHLPVDRHVEKDGAKYRLVPIAWNPVI